MNTFRSMISGPGDGVSSKRSVMVWFVLMFSFITLINLFTGKKLEHDIQVQLFELVVVSIGVVFGEPFMNFLLLVRGQKTTATTTTIAPPGSTVTNTETTKEIPQS